MKKIALFGSSGSIGRSTLDVVRQFPDMFRIEALAVNSSVEALATQMEEFRPAYAYVTDSADAGKLQEQFPSVKVFNGGEGLLRIARDADYDIFVGAMVGSAGLAPTVEAVKRGARIALANKETLVVAGELVTDLCKKYGAELIPVDSEHSAIFQCLTGEQASEVKKIILTASGGPFLHKDRDALAGVSVQEALNHPTWKMGAKITIDSASMMNKGLEVIEARWLFGIPPSQIEVVVHPQSIIHSMVEFVDGSVKAQLSTPDMRLPIQYALTWPQRLPAGYVTTNFASLGALTFFEPDFEKFKCLRLAFDVLESGGTHPCVLNASNEIAVEKFLQGAIPFTAIPELISGTLQQVEYCKHPDLETIFNCDRQARRVASNFAL